jgi:hypothetical protein
MYKYIQDVPQPPRRITISKSGRLIVIGLAILTFCQVMTAIAMYATRHQAWPLFYLAVDAAIWVMLLRYFFAKEADLFRNGIATTATISLVSGNNVAYTFTVAGVSYHGSRRVTVTSASQVRPGVSIPVVYDPANPARNLPITAGALVEIAR